MHIRFVCLIVILYVLCEVNAAYNKDITCVIDVDKEPVCKISTKVRRRSNSNIGALSHDPYIPRDNSLLYNCTTECSPIRISSMTELTNPNLHLKQCFVSISTEDNYACETIRYNHLKNIDKLLFLSKTIPSKTFYLVDCLIYSDGGRVCHKKNMAARRASHVQLIEAGALVRPNETHVLSQDEFLCEEDEAKNIKCDLNPFVPFEDGLKLKKAIKFDDNVLLKSNSFVIELKRGCLESWCGYLGQAAPSRRQYSYIPPGGQIFRCFYANKQQVCKQWGNPQQVYNLRSWLKR